MTYTWNAWGICIPAICIPDYGCHLCFASPHNYECIYVQHLAEYLWTYFSEDTGVPVCWICHMHPIKIYSNIRFQNISSWSDICNICLAFWTECDGNSSTSFSKIGLYEIKRQESTRLRTFLFCVVQIEIASPTACDQGQNLSRGFMSVLGAPLNLYNWYLKKNMSNLLYSSPTYKNPLVNIPPAQFTTQILIKVLRVQHEDIFQKQSAES